MKSESIKEITAALSKAQLAFLPIKKTEDVDYQTSAGRKHYAYAPLSEVIEATRKGLADNGLAITQTTKLVEGNTILVTLLSHSSGEWIESELYVGKQDQAPQSEGSSLTYKRRYGLSAMLNVSSEGDDDAQSVKEPVKKAETKTASPILPTEPAKPSVAPPVKSGEGVKGRDIPRILTIEKLAQALKEDFGLSYEQQWTELNIENWNGFPNLKLTPAQAYQQVAGVRKGGLNGDGRN